VTQDEDNNNGVT